MTYMGPGRTLPDKRAKTQKGKILVRIDADLHNKFIEFCESRSISMNQYLSDTIKEVVSRDEARKAMERYIVQERFRNSLP